MDDVLFTGDRVPQPGTRIPSAVWQEAQALLERAQGIVLTTHAAPDGDGIGSMVGLSLPLRERGKTIAMVCADRVPRSLAFIPYAAEVQERRSLADLPFSPELIVVFDSNDLSRLGPLYTENQRLFATAPIINIDHHYTNTRFGTVNLVDDGAAATAEIVHTLLELLRAEPSLAAATALLTALVTDTIGLRTASVTPHTLRLTAHLLEHGAPLQEIAYRALYAKRYAGLKLWGYALSHMERSSDGRIVWVGIPTAVRQALDARETDLVGLASFLADMEEVAVVILAWENKAGEIQFSFRSRTTDVSAIAQVFAGGGHRLAAGATVAGPLAPALQRAVAAAEAHLGQAEAERVSRLSQYR